LNLHTEAHRTTSYGLPDAAKSDNAQRLSEDVVSQQHLQAPGFPLSGSREAVAFDHPPGGGHQEGPGKVGRRFGQHARSIGHKDAQTACILDIDVVEADGDVANDPNVRDGLQDLAVNDVGEQRHRALLSLQPRNQFLFGKDAVIRVGVYRNLGP
jgi:hypothetical protein